MFEFWNRGFFNKVLVISSILFFIFTWGIVDATAHDNIDALTNWATIALVNFAGLLIGFWGADY